MRLFIYGLIISAFLLAASCRPAAAPISISNKPVSINNIPQTNLPLPPIKGIETLGWQTLKGDAQKFAAYRGKVLVLDLWATYCPPCLEEIPHLNSLQTKYGEKIQVVGLHVGGAEDERNVPAFVEKLKINYSLAFPEDELMRILTDGNDAIPQTFVFDRNGKLVKKIVGFDNIAKAELDDAIEQVIN